MKKKVVILLVLAFLFGANPDKVFGTEINENESSGIIDNEVFEINVNCGDGGSIVVVGNSVTDTGENIAKGESRIILATPETGYKITSVEVLSNGTPWSPETVEEMWWESYVDLENGAFTFVIDEVDANYSFEVTFELKTYDISCHTIYEDLNGEVISANVENFEVEYDEKLVLDFVPDANFQVKNIIINGKEIAPSDCFINDNGYYQYTITNIASDIEIVELYSVIPVKKIAVSFEKLGISLKNHKENEATLTDNIAYARSFSINSTNGTEYRLSDSGTYASNIKVNTNTLISYLYVKEQNPTVFGTEQKVFLTDEIKLIVDTTQPEITLTDEQSEIWVNNRISRIKLSGTATDEYLDYVIWSESALSDEEILECANKVKVSNEYSFYFNNIKAVLDAGMKEYYLYAVDKAGNCSDEAIVNVYYDGTSAVIEEITILNLEEVSKFTYGNFTNKSIILNIKAKDAEQENNNFIYSSGIKAIEVYAGNERIGTKEIEEAVLNSNIISTTIEIPYQEAGGFSGLKDMHIRVFDNVGNPSKFYNLSDFIADVSNKVMIEKDVPTVNIDTKVENGVIYEKKEGNSIQYWYSHIPIISYSVDDRQNGKSGSGLSKREITLNGVIIDQYTKDNYSEVSEYSNVVQKESDTLMEDSLINMVQGENQIQISFRDLADNYGCDIETIYLDGYSPRITGFEINSSHASEYDSKAGEYSFGNFYNDKIEITVYATDNLDEADREIPSSGIKAITLYLNGKTYETKYNVESGKAVFVLPAEDVISDNEKIYLDTIIEASVTDMVNNSSEIVGMNAVDNGLKSSRVMIENIKPELGMLCKTECFEDGAGIIYTQDDIEFEIDIKDTQSGLQKAIIFANENVLEEKVYNQEGLEKCFSDSMIINTKDAVLTSDNLYEIKVVVIDNAGNENIKIQKIYKDLSAPKITEFEMLANDKVISSGNNIQVSDMPYGYFFSEDTKVIMHTSDGDKASSCGVKEIHYYTITSQGVRSEIKNVAVDSSGVASFIVPAGFKGQIYACAYDNIMNSQDGFVSPEGLIIDTKEMHNQEKHIYFDVPEALNKTSNGQGLYPENVKVILTISDMVSGIRGVEWSVDGPQDKEQNQSGSIEVDNNGLFTSANDGWKVTQIEKNLVTEMQKEISVSNNSNDITVHVKMTDWAGNISEDEIKLSIDKKEPIIEVDFDNNVSDSVYTEMYNSNRVAIITVKERNFLGTNFAIDITNTDGSMPIISDWETNINEGNPDETVSSATVTFSEDGDYTMRISGTDLAGNSAAVIDVKNFTIDKTKPRINVSYDNNNALNGNYFSGTRTAILSITEHNFAPERVHITGTVTNESGEVVFPTNSNWSQDGDVYTTTITCDADGLYRFDVEYSDKAGNIGEKFVGDYYYVDKTAPVIKISGVENFSANNGKVVPIISMSDANYDSESVNIELVGANRGDVIPNGEYVSQKNGQIYTFSDFPIEQEYDDMYTLNVALRDLAGNESTESIVFSVNRFGSVYIFDNSLKQISGNYVKEEIDVKLTEINIDSLMSDTIRIVVDTNGVSRDLSEGKDYTITQIGGDGTWYQYEYNIDHSLFAGDGRYIVTLYSEDRAGNINQNIDETKKAEVSFGVDKTAPIIIPIDIENDTQYAVDSKSATIVVNDNLLLDDVAIYVGSTECEYTLNGENYTFEIPSSSEIQSVTVVARDMAGNSTNYVISDILVTTNIFVRWYNNKILFAGTLSAITGILGMTVLLRIRRFKTIR